MGSDGKFYASIPGMTMKTFQATQSVDQSRVGKNETEDVINSDDIRKPIVLAGQQISKIISSHQRGPSSSQTPLMPKRASSERDNILKVQKLEQKLETQTEDPIASVDHKHSKLMQASQMIKNIEDYSEIFQIANSQSTSLHQQQNSASKFQNNIKEQTKGMELRSSHFNKNSSLMNFQNTIETRNISDQSFQQEKPNLKKPNHHYSSSMINQQPSLTTLNTSNNTRIHPSELMNQIVDKQPQNVMLKNPVLYQKLQFQQQQMIAKQLNQMTKSSEYAESKMSSQRQPSTIQSQGSKFNSPTNNQKWQKKNDIMTCLNGIMPSLRQQTGNISNSEVSPINGVIDGSKRYIVDQPSSGQNNKNHILSNQNSQQDSNLDLIHKHHQTQSNQNYGFPTNTNAENENSNLSFPINNQYKQVNQSNFQTRSDSPTPYLHHLQQQMDSNVDSTHKEYFPDQHYSRAKPDDHSNSYKEYAMIDQSVLVNFQIDTARTNFSGLDKNKVGYLQTKDEELKQLLRNQQDFIKRNSVQITTGTQIVERQSQSESSFQNKPQVSRLNKYDEGRLNDADRQMQLLKKEYKERLSNQFISQHNIEWLKHVQQSKRNNTNSITHSLEQDQLGINIQYRLTNQQISELFIREKNNFESMQSYQQQNNNLSPIRLEVPFTLAKLPFNEPKLDSPGVRKPNMNESHVRRARLHLDKKKKEFEQPSRQNRSNQVNQISNILVDGTSFNGGDESSLQLIGTNGKALPGFVCVPNITYKSILPGTNRPLKQNSIAQQVLNPPTNPSQARSKGQRQIIQAQMSFNSKVNQSINQANGLLQYVNIQTVNKNQILMNECGETADKKRFFPETVQMRAELQNLTTQTEIHRSAHFDLASNDAGIGEDGQAMCMKHGSYRVISHPHQRRSQNDLKKDDQSSNFQFGVPVLQKNGRIQVVNQNGDHQTYSKQDLEFLGLNSMQMHTIQISQAQANERLQRLAQEGQIVDARLLAQEMVQADLAHRSLSRMLMSNSSNEIATKAGIQIRGRSEHINKKADSPTKAGKENGTPSTKPATSATTSTNRATLLSAKKELENKAKQLPKTDNGKRKPPIFFVDETPELYKNHRVNKAVNLINHIIRLIFKNNKDSLALTASTGNTQLGPNSVIDVSRINELQKIAKQINIQIPRKFDSKASLREFFYSRDFILNVKIKMNNLLHKAILATNQIPSTLIEQGSQENGLQLSKKYWVGGGNNSNLIKSVLKQRYWWQCGSEENFGSDCDFIWTAWKKNRHIEFLTNASKEWKNKVKNEKKKEEEKIEQQSSKKRKREDDEDLKKLVLAKQLENIVRPVRLYNRLEQNKQLTNKKGLFINMRRYYEMLGQDPFTVLPLTFHTRQGINDPDFKKFEKYYQSMETQIKRKSDERKKAVKNYNEERKKRKQLQKDQDLSSEESSDEDKQVEKIKAQFKMPKQTWIVKPGENTNCGQGITVVKSISEVKSLIGSGSRSKEERTYIIQKYIDYPLLVHKRKFDFRCYGMLTSINGSLKGFAYSDGYVRTSCREFNLDDVSDQYIHLTNDAIQKHAEDYGKYENANKISFSDFSKVICNQQPDLDFDMYRDLMPQIHKLMADTFKAAYTKIDPTRLQNTFELFGYDFMIDENFKLYLIEVNTNPCLEICCPLLARIIPEVIDNCFRITLDPLFPSPDLSHNRKFQLNELPQEVKFSLVFDEDVEGDKLKQIMMSAKGSIREVDEDIASDKECELNENEEDLD